jgi:hypothetical protein
VLGGEGVLDLLVVDDAALAGVDQEHLAGLQPALLDDLRRVDVDHADLGRHHHEVVVGDPVPARAEAVAVEHGTDHVPSVKVTLAGPSHGSIRLAWKR